MQVSSETLRGTYLEKLFEAYPGYKPEDFFALICCGDDLENPYDGWSGFAACPVFADAIPDYYLFFGDFPNSLAEYENVPEFSIQRGVSKVAAFDELVSYLTSHSDNPVLISSNADTWLKPIMLAAVEGSTSGPWNAQFVCLRKLYSFVYCESDFSCRPPYLGQCFNTAPDLPQRFGLYTMARSLGINVPNCSSKPVHRAKTTAAVASDRLLSPYPSK